MLCFVTVPAGKGGDFEIETESEKLINNFGGITTCISLYLVLSGCSMLTNLHGCSQIGLYVFSAGRTGLNKKTSMGSLLNYFQESTRKKYPYL